ncbi:2OG-Fe dioxygenase family protein [Tsuneonella flava]|uniref:2OG-Fe dioxygenase family protein n=1 Tax=Tsuneonella flava TaxID=2055955 RepID=A0ABX7K749_9SPHN|nr:2OG-Fe dioxygenase family protein [Tsuneonella flava]QSB44048.1 2OG-Fe dioxygenase family protein [Tsuneonella flava]
MTGQLAATSGECIATPPALLLPPGKLVDPDNPEWGAFARSWDDLPRDTWMTDGGTYRRRRYAAFEVAGGKCTRLPHRPHYQERNHNPLNGGVERWFAPMTEGQTGSRLFQALVAGTTSLIANASTVSSASWTVEAHQFRIEALSGQPGLPTPEGMHHDGRDWVLILLVGGSDYAGGESRVEEDSGACILEHRLTRPGEAMLLNDREVRHGTTPIESAIPGNPAWRDTLVLTFAQARES